MKGAPGALGLAACGLALASALGATRASAESGVSPMEIAHTKPGTIFRIWPLEGGVRAGYKGYRVLYRSTGMNGEPVAVSGAVIFPAAPAKGRARNVVAWAHPTSGVVSKCAPTLMPDLAGTIMGIDRFTDEGYVVVATDYVGLGTKDHHPYLIGRAAAHSVLDSVRAAKQLGDVAAGNRFVVWGHSQGGHAALFTGELAATYAPELELAGVAAAAPATYLADLFKADAATASGRTLTAMALYSWSKAFAFPLEEFVESSARARFDRLANDCIESIEDFIENDEDERALGPRFLKVDPTENPMLIGIMQNNTPGVLPRGTPVFLAQGTADEVVRPAITHRYREAICGAGAKVKVHTMNGVPHMTAARDSAFAAAAWMADRFARRAAPSDC